MISLNELNPSKHILARSRLMWAIRKSRDGSVYVYRVTPHGREFNHKEKDKRIVTIDLEKETAECVSLETGELCEANAEFVPNDPERPKVPRLCSHVLSALRAIKKTASSRSVARGGAEAVAGS